MEQRLADGLALYREEPVRKRFLDISSNSPVFSTYTEKNPHICPDGSIGYADFQGFKKEGEPVSEWDENSPF